MNAEIQITAGPGLGQSTAWRGPFFRIGSDAECDLVLTGEEPRALIVRSVDGKPVVYNRSLQPVKVGRKPVAPEGSAAWRAGQPLRMPSGIELQWSTAASASSLAGETALDAVPDSIEHVDSEPVNKKPPGRTVLMSLAIVGVGLLIFDDGASLNVSAQRIEALVSDLQYLQDPRLCLVRSSIQLGRLAELRGNTTSAGEHYRQAQERLRATPSTGHYQPDWARVERVAREVVNDRLKACGVGG